MTNASRWTPYKLDQLGTVSRGRSRHRPRNEPSLYGGPYPFFQTGDIKAAELYLRNFEQTYSEKGLAQSKLWEPGTVCITIAANIAETAILALRGCFPDSVVGFVADQSKSDPRFIKYYIDLIKLSMQNVSRGTTQDNLSVDKLLSFDFLVPPLPTQRKIASILSAYDDLIENNTRRIAILEEMAQAIYREWFVNFRFPGHENVKLVDSKIGKIPEGWEVRPLADCCKLVMGQSPKSEFYNDSGEGLAFHQGVTNFGPRYPTHKTFCTVENRLASEGDILFSVRAPVGRINIANTEIIVGRGVSAIRRNDDAQIFLFHQLKDKFKEEDIMGGGTIFKSVTKKDLASLPLLNPPEDVLAAFESMVGASFTLYENLTKTNDNLRITRDLLLPKLISGKLDVEDLDIHVMDPIQTTEEASS